MSDHEEEHTIAEDLVVTKYKMAGEIVNRKSTEGLGGCAVTRKLSSCWAAPPCLMHYLETLLSPLKEHIFRCLARCFLALVWVPLRVPVQGCCIPLK